MPIKRAKSKSKSKLKKAFDSFNFDDLFKSAGFKVPSFSFDPKPKPRRLNKWEEAESNILHVEIERVINNIHPKKMPDRNGPEFWSKIVDKIPKNLIGRAIKYRRKWKEELKVAMDKKHEANLYRKN